MLERERRQKLVWFLATFVFFYLCFLVFSYITVGVLGNSYPLGDFRFFPDDRYKDFFTINQAVEELNPYISKLSNYPPIILIFAYFFARMGDYSSYNMYTLRYAIEDSRVMKSLYLFFVIYIIAFAVVVFYYGFILGKSRETRGSPVNKDKNKEIFKYKVRQFLISGFVGLILMLSAPSIYMFDRGNYLGVTIIFYMLWAIFEDQKNDSILGAVFGALCAATKVYPIYILLLYIVEKKYKKFGAAIITGAVVTLLPIFIFRGSYIENVKEFVLGVMGFGGGNGQYSVYFTVGITGFVGYMYRLFGMVPNPRIIKLIWLAMGAVTTLGGLYFLKDEKATWKKLLIITALMIYLTPNSFLYNSTYLFGPLLIMLAGKDKIKKSDIPYFVICALLLVPKAYSYLPDLPVDMHAYFNTVNCGVLIDSFLYFAIIFYYLALHVRRIILKDHRAYEGRRISDQKELDKKIVMIFNIGIAVSALIAVWMVLWTVRDTALSCHDSIEDFIKARIGGASKGYQQGFEYGLARGRVGFIFPAVIALRYYINSTGNYLAIWLMQYIPVMMNVGLFSYMIGKKFGKIYGSFFALFFLGLLQIDIWHSLVTCYPLDFMYGLFIALIGVMLFDSYLAKKLAGTAKKTNVIKLILSAVLFYESMQVYEAFIVASLVYAVIAMSYAQKKIGRKWKELFKTWAFALLPHFIVAVVYLGILVFIRSHPVVDTAVSNIGGTTEFRYFALPYTVYSLGMFPLVDIRVLPSVKGLFFHFSRRGVLLAGAAFCSFLAITMYTLVKYRRFTSEERHKERRKLVTVLMGAVAFAMTFAIPHALIPSYQEWVNVAHVGGYVPTTICYFGWSVALFALYLLILEYVSYRQAIIRRIFTCAASFFFAIAVFLTFGINVSFKSYETTSGTWTSIKARVFYDMLHDEELIKRHPDVIFTNDMSGVHNKIKNNETLAEHELGYDVDMYNDHDIFEQKVNLDEKTICCYCYDPDAYAAMLVDAENCGTYDTRWTTDEPLYLYTPYEGDFMIVYRYSNGLTSSVTFHADSNGCYVDLGDDVAVNTIDVRRLG